MPSYKLQFVILIITCFYQSTSGGLEITTLPKSSSSCLPINNTSNPGGAINVSGNASRSCNLQIDTLSSAAIQISIIAVRNTSGTDYIYLERMGPSYVCPNRYVVFMEPLQQCIAYFRHDTIHLHFQFRGDFILSIQEGMIQDRGDDVRCPEDNDIVDDVAGQAPMCKQLKGFGSVIQCDWKNSSLTAHGESCVKCNFECLAYCTCIVNDKQIIRYCTNKSGDEIGQNNSFILFPSNVSCLDLSENDITDLRLGVVSTFLNNLSTLSLDCNLLNSLQLGVFDNLYKLETLNLSINLFKTLPKGLFDNLQNLIVLELFNNSIASLSANIFHNLHKLEFLELGDNFLTEIPLFDNLISLRQLQLYCNDLTILKDGAFRKLYGLKELLLEGNQLAQIVVGTFSNLTSLIILSVAHNILRFLAFNLFDDLQNLVRLDLSYNQLQSIPRLGKMKSLSIVYLIGNPLTKLSKNVFLGLENKHYSSVFVDQPEICLCYGLALRCHSTVEPSPYLTCSSLLSLIGLKIFTWVLGLCAALGNGFVLWWRRSESRNSNKVQSFLLLNLAMSDLLMGIYMIIIASADVYFGEFFPMSAERWRSGVICRIASTLAITSSEASVFFLTLISVDRFINIKFPYTLHKLGIKSTIIVSSLIWMFSLILGLTASVLAGGNPDFYDNSHVCIGLPLAQTVEYKVGSIESKNIASWESEPSTIDVILNGTEQKKPGLYFSVAMFIGLNMFCFLLIFAVYVSIIRAVAKTSKEASRQRQLAEEIRLTIKVSAIVLTDFCCWFPICIIGALVQSGIIKIHSSVFPWIVTFILPINSAINPFLYTIGAIISDKRAKERCSTEHTQMQQSKVRNSGGSQ